MKELLTLFLTFCRIGGLTFGGGYAMLPMLRKEVVDKYNWITEEELLDCYAIGQCTPGIIAVNTATYIGYKQKKIAGALSATLGMVFPSLVIITLIASVLNNVTDIPAVAHGLAGVRIGVGVLIVNAVIGMWKNGVKDFFDIIMFALVLLVSVLFSVSPIIIIACIIPIGIIYGRYKRGGV